MLQPILETKLYIPPPRADHVPRPALVKKLNTGLNQKLSLVSAPAGYGKTSLISEWVQQCSRPTAWLSLDARDNSPSRFFRYLAAALEHTLRPEQPGGFTAPDPGETADFEIQLASWINTIAALDTPFLIVLDDYHVITDTTIHTALLFLLEHAPDALHLVISSRSDPPWPLARLRANGDIHEIRQRDLRFSAAETQALLNEVMGLDLSPDDLAALEGRVEGWVAGLHLAMLSLKVAQDKQSFIRAFTGSQRFVMDYLMEEVLIRQPPDVQDFLLKTSILDRLTAPLCDAMLESGSSREMLSALESGNSFLVSLDDERRWYRYHHLFRDLLRGFLQREHADEIHGLHQRAGLWYEGSDLHADAVVHALAADDTSRIVHLTSQLTVSGMDDGEMNMLATWLGQVPHSTLKLNPSLFIAQAWTSFHKGDYQAVETDLAHLKDLLIDGAMPEDEAARVRGQMAAIRSYLVELQADPQSTIRQTDEALALLSEEDLRLRAFIGIRRANSLVRVGQLEAAIQAYQEAAEAGKRAGDRHSALIASSEIALVRLISGKLQESVRQIDAARASGEAQLRRVGRLSPAAGVLYRHLSTIYRETGDLENAESFAGEAVRVCDSWGAKEAMLYALLALTRIRHIQGEIVETGAAFERILRMAAGISPRVERNFHCFILLHRLQHGETLDAAAWLGEIGLSAGDEIPYERHQEYAVLARYLLQTRKYVRALRVVEGLQVVLEKAGAGWAQMQNQVLRARILEKMKRTDEALDSLRRALSQAAGQGWMRIFLDEGPSIAPLLRHAVAVGIETAFTGRILTALQEAGSRPEIERIEPLSERETQVLRLLAADLKTPAIAAELFISVSTVRTHVKHIYTKLDAHSRHEAVTNARQLDLL